METKEIIKHCQNQNKIAQGILFNTYYQHMYNLSMRLLSNHHDVEDVLINSFTKVFNKIRDFEYRGEHSLRKWIKTIVINESIRYLNKKQCLLFEENITEFEEYFIPESIEIEEFDAELIYSIIESMPPGYRTIFNLFAIEGYSHKEISELLNISENTSKSQLRKARLNIIEKTEKLYNYGQAKYR